VRQIKKVSIKSIFFMSKICVVVDDLKGYTRKWRRVQIYFNLFQFILWFFYKSSEIQVCSCFIKGILRDKNVFAKTIFVPQNLPTLPQVARTVF
ncbi:MAG: hypothetical protein ACJAVF_002690, partial [Paraglaciecola sp.]